MKNELENYIVRDVLHVGGLDVIDAGIAVSLIINAVVVSSCIAGIWLAVQLFRSKRVF